MLLESWGGATATIGDSLLAPKGLSVRMLIAFSVHALSLRTLVSKYSGGAFSFSTSVLIVVLCWRLTIESWCPSACIVTEQLRSLDQSYDIKMGVWVFNCSWRRWVIIRHLLLSRLTSPVVPDEGKQGLDYRSSGWTLNCAWLLQPNCMDSLCPWTWTTNLKIFLVRTRYSTPRVLSLLPVLLCTSWFLSYLRAFGFL